MYFIEDRIENNDFRVANYFNLFNIAHLRLFIEKIHSILETWTSIRNEFDNFCFYANANLFDWLNEIEKSNDIDVKQIFSFVNCVEQKLFATTTFCFIYQLFTCDETISQNIVSDNDVEYNEFTFENWYRDFCLLRYYWRERTRKFQKEDDVSKKQNITTKMFQFFNEIQFLLKSIIFTDVAIRVQLYESINWD